MRTTLTTSKESLNDYFLFYVCFSVSSKYFYRKQAIMPCTESHRRVLSTVE